MADAKSNIEPFAVAYEQYVRAMQSLDVPTELEERATKAFSSYTEAVISASAAPDVARQVADAFAQYADVVRDIRSSEGVGEVFDEAYRRFLQDARAAWNAVDIESLDAGSLASIGQSMVTVSWMVAAAEMGGEVATDVAADTGI